jgi:hypothetical protein
VKRVGRKGHRCGDHTSSDLLSCTETMRLDCILLKTVKLSSFNSSSYLLEEIIIIFPPIGFSLFQESAYLLIRLTVQFMSFSSFISLFCASSSAYKLAKVNFPTTAASAEENLCYRRTCATTVASMP